jgi:hypothetical protein
MATLFFPPTDIKYVSNTANLALATAQSAFATANSGGGGGGNYFGTVNAAGTLLVADTSGDVLTIEAGSGISIVGDAVNDKLTISATGGSTDIAAAYDKANSANIIASSAYDKANAANLLAFNTGIGANAFASETISGANTAVGAGANNYANATFVKLIASNQTIAGNVSITGSLLVSGNTYRIDANTLSIQDPLIYLAGNNYTSDIVDIGFIANYVNATGANVHTGLFRDASTKMYYLFQGYDQEPINNVIDPAGNNISLAVLNSDVVTSNLNLGGANAIIWIKSAYDQANNTGAGSNAFTSATIAGANTAVGAGANAYANLVWSRSNSYIQTTIAGANAAVGAGANAFATVVWNASNTSNAVAIANINYVNTAMQAAFAKANSGGLGNSLDTQILFNDANTVNGSGTLTFAKGNNTLYATNLSVTGTTTLINATTLNVTNLITASNIAANNLTITGNTTLANATTLTISNLNATNLTITGTITFDSANSIIINDSEVNCFSYFASSTGNQTVDAFANTYRSVLYQVSMNAGSNFQSTQISVLHNDVDAFMSEYGTIRTSGTDLATFTVAYANGLVMLNVNPTSTSTGIKVFKTSILK